MYRRIPSSLTLSLSLCLAGIFQGLPRFACLWFVRLLRVEGGGYKFWRVVARLAPKVRRKRCHHHLCSADRGSSGTRVVLPYYRRRGSRFRIEKSIRQFVQSIRELKEIWPIVLKKYNGNIQNDEFAWAIRQNALPNW